MTVSISQVQSSKFIRQVLVPPEPVLRFSVEQYHEMIRASILTADDQVELLEGWLVYKMPKNPPHRITTKLIQRAFEKVIISGWYVDTQEPITVEDSEPEPDVAIIRGDTRDYSDRHPGASDLALLVEVAESTLERDRKLKKRLYARAGVSVYWIVNLAERKIETYSQPVATGVEPDYADRLDYGATDSIPLTIEGREIARFVVKDLLP